MLFAAGVWALAAPAAAETAALGPDNPWRVFLMCQQQERKGGAPVLYTPAPPATWTQADFDDSGWGR